MPEARPGPGHLARWRCAAAALGVASIAFGTWQLLTGGISTRLSSSLPWLAGSLLVHDGVLAPLLVLAGWALTRLLPATARRLAAVALLVAGSLVIVGLPPLLAPGVSDNPTTTPRDYGHGLLVALAAVAAGTLLAVLATAGASLLRRRR